MSANKKAEDFLYEARLTERLRMDDLKEVNDEMARLYAKQKRLNAKLDDVRADIKHWKDVVASERFPKGETTS